jgi:predicted RNase H-like HicB family nuclease
MSADAIEGYLECLQEDGLPLPESDLVTVPPRVDQIRVKLASK